MEPTWAKRVRLGVTLSAVLAWVVVILWGIAGEPPGGRQDFLGSALAFGAITLGPFAIYYFGIRMKEFSVLIGACLIGLTGWALYLSFSSSSSTAGLNILWIPLVGYPLVVVAVLVDRLSH